MAHERFADIVGNTVEECIEKAIKELNLEKNTIRFVVLNDGIQTKPAKIRVCLKPKIFQPPGCKSRNRNYTQG
jgi:hypothetical protein